MQRMQTEELGPSLLNVLRPEYRDNPYAYYRLLREEHPVVPRGGDEDANLWLVTGYLECATVLNDDRFVAQRIGMDLSWLPPGEEQHVGPIYRAISKQLLFIDPPAHTRLRSLATKAFTPRVVEMMRSHIQELVDGLLDEVTPAGQIDVIADLAYPLPAIVIAELLGVPPEHRDRFKQWSDSFARFLDGGQLTPESAAQALRDVGEMMAYFHEVIAYRRTAPRDDLLQALIAAEEQGDRLTEEELLGNLVLLLAAGHETTTNLIGNGMLALLRHPDQLELFKEQPRIAPSAVNELLRYEPPVQATERLASVDVELGGRRIPAGTYVTVVLAAANRDPRQFADPDRLDLRRPDNRHLSFGYGPHFCLGAALARLEGQIALTTLLRRLPNLRLLDETPRWDDSIIFRSLRSLRIGFT